MYKEGAARALNSTNMEGERATGILQAPRPGPWRTASAITYWVFSTISEVPA